MRAFYSPTPPSRCQVFHSSNISTNSYSPFYPSFGLPSFSAAPCSSSWHSSCDDEDDGDVVLISSPLPPPPPPLIISAPPPPPPLWGPGLGLPPFWAASSASEWNPHTPYNVERQRMFLEAEESTRRHERAMQREDTNRAIAVRGPTPPVVNNANTGTAASAPAAGGASSSSSAPGVGGASASSSPAAGGAAAASGPAAGGGGAAAK